MDLRLIGTKAERPNDLYTFSKIFYNAYKKAVTYNNIVNGFDACGLWSLKGGVVNHDVIKPSDITNRDE